MLFLEFVPIGWLHGTSAACPRSLADAPWPLGALLMAGRIFVDEDPLGPQIREFRIAVVSQKQSPSAVADENKSIMRYLEIHILLPRVCNAIKYRTDSFRLDHLMSSGFDVGFAQTSTKNRR
jgi:hypothetical protein